MTIVTKLFITVNIFSELKEIGNIGRWQHGVLTLNLTTSKKMTKKFIKR